MSKATDLEKAVKKYLTLKGCWFLRIPNYRCFKCGQIMNSPASGWPDFYIYGPDNTLAVEVKTGQGRMKPKQIEIKERLESRGIQYLVLHDTIDELMKIL